MLKKIISILLMIIMCMSLTLNAFAQNSGTYTESTDSVVITGHLTGADVAEKTVNMMLVKLNDGNAVEEIKYVNTAVTDASGNYSFNFKLDSSESGKKVESYKLRVNEGNGNNASDSVLTVAYDPNKISINLDKTELVGTTASSVYNNRIYVKGQLDEGYYNEVVNMMLVNPDAPNPIGYVATTRVKYDGSFEFRFKFSGDLTGYAVKVNKGDVEVSDKVIEAVAETETKFFEGNPVLTEKGVEVTYDVTVLNPYGLDKDNYNKAYSQILAFYDESDNRQVDVKISEVAPELSENGEDLVCTITANVPEGATKVKAFIWSDMETLVPILGSSEIKANERIVCWGDSLTEGGYPEVLAEKTGKEVLNYGIGGNTATEIALRQGGVGIVVEEAFTVPADPTELIIKLHDENGSAIDASAIAPRTMGDKGINPVTINGVEGTLGWKKTQEATDTQEEVVDFKFERKEAGEAVSVSAGDKVHSWAEKSGVYDDINVIFIGTNGGYPDGSAAGLISVIDSMLSKLNTDRYVVLGLTYGNKGVNPHLEEKYGAKYIDLWEWLTSDEAATQADITYTDQDLADIADGLVPTSFRKENDKIHYNQTGRELVAHIVAEKLKELNYIK